MKPFKMLLLSLVVFAISFGCDNDDKKSYDFKPVVKTWTLVSASLDNEPAAQILESFTLKITDDKSYEVAGTEFPSPWPSNGTFTVSSSSENSGILHRDDDTDIAYVLADDGKLTMTFSFNADGYAGAREKTVGGDWVFVLE